MNKKKRSTSRMMIDYLLRFKFKIFLAVVASIPVSLISASPAWIVQELLDKVLNAGNETYLILIVIGLPILLLLKGIFYFIQNYLMAYVGQKLIISIRYDVFSHLQKVSLSFFSKKTTGHLISRMTNDVNMVQAMIRGSMSILNDVITLICLFGYIFYLHWKLTLLVFVVLPFIGGIVRKFSKKIRKVGHDMQEKMADVTSVMHEAISGVQITRAFTMEEHEIERFHNKDRESMKAQLKGVRLQSTVLPVVEFMNTVGLAIVMFYGGQIVINGELTTGQLIGFLAGLGMTFSPIKRLTNVNSVIQQSLAAADRIFALMEEDIEENEEDGKEIVQNIEGSVEFEDVYFSYDGKYDVIKGLDLKVRPGEIVAFVGPSGGGKSTIVSLIPRFYTPHKGIIRVDGKNVNDVSVKSLRKHMAIVPQDTILFTGTISENISYGNPDATIEEVIEAAKMANAHNFITEFREGYDTQVGERGALLSGGQKQRIAIARALLRNAKILILDEATSALDSESEALVQDALENLMEEKTTFVIAHRLSTIRKADKICVVDDGTIVQIGTHEELMEKGGEYRQIYNAQFYFLEEAYGE